MNPLTKMVIHLMAQEYGKKIIPSAFAFAKESGKEGPTVACDASDIGAFLSSSYEEGMADALEAIQKGAALFGGLTGGPTEAPSREFARAAHTLLAHRNVLALAVQAQGVAVEPIREALDSLARACESAG